LKLERFKAGQLAAEDSDDGFLECAFKDTAEEVWAVEEGGVEE
jgi:hypothetical protein